MESLTKWITATIFAMAIIPAAVQAQESLQDDFKKTWSYFTLHDDKESDFIQKLSLTGRFQYDMVDLDSKQGDYYSDGTRRFRLGLKSTILNEFILHIEGDFDLNTPEPAYKRLTDANLAWSPAGADYTVKMGKQGAAFTLDGSTSSKQLLTIDRSNLANNFWFPNEYIPGITLSGNKADWFYNVGIFSSGTADKEFGDFDAGYFSLLSLGHDFSEAWEVDQADIRLDYVYQKEDDNNTFTRSNAHVGSLNSRYKNGSWGLRTDFAAAQTYDGANKMYGVTIMPYYSINDYWQVVTRYTGIRSSSDNGVRLARYDNRIVGGRGDEYQEFYAGLNWFIYGHKVKLQAGVTYAEMADNAADGGDYEGVGFVGAFRVSW